MITSAEWIETLEGVDVDYVERVFELFTETLKKPDAFGELLKKPYSQYTPTALSVSYGYDSEDQLPNAATILYLHHKAFALGWFMSTETRLNTEKRGAKPEFKSTLSHVLRPEPSAEKSSSLFGGLFGL